MNRLFRIFILVMAMQVVFVHVSWAETRDDSDTFSASAEITGSGTVDASLVSIVAGGPVTEITFRDLATITPANPWRSANQYIGIRYNSNWASWGVRVLTDNIPFLGAVLSPSTDLNFIKGDKIDIDPTATTAWRYAYSGLIGSRSNWTNPHMRATLGFQVYGNPLAAGTYPAVPTVTIGATVAPEPTGTKITDVGVGGYGIPWGYIGDKTVRLVGAGDTVGADAFDGNIYLGLTTDVPPRRMYNDNLIVYGSGAGGGTLSSHRIGSVSESGDNDIAVYLSARFANTDWGRTPSVAPFALPADTYRGRIVVEIVHE